MIALALTALAVGFAIIRLIWPGLGIDVVTLVLILVALLPWLGLLFESIELPGGWKLEYHHLAERMERTERDVANVAHSARMALGAATGAIADGADPLPSDYAAQVDSGAAPPLDVDLPEPIAALAHDYAMVCAEPRRPERTGIMDRIFGRLVAAAPQAPRFDVAAALNSEHVGIRLAGYAHLYAQPNPRLITELVDALTEREWAPFNQYWAIRALAIIVEHDGPDVVSRGATQKLVKLSRRLPKESARYHMLSRMFQVFGFDVPLP